MPNNLIVGNDGVNALDGTAGSDLIYGFNPEGPQGQVNSIAATRVAAGLTQPLFVAAPPGDTQRLFIVEKTGVIKIFDLATQQVLATPFLDVSTQILTAGEEGLLGLAFDPDFAQNGFFYVNLINTNGDTEIRRYHVSPPNPNQAEPGSGTLIITIDQPNASNHKAGWLGFGPDGFLYAALGDGGGADDQFHNGQNVDTLLGTILRIDVHSDAFPADPSRNYAIPADNPFVGVAGADEIWAFGLRNPWRPGFDRGLGDLYIADVGQGSWEEVDIGIKGANYGWNHYEGNAVFPNGDPVSSSGTLTFPINTYDHSIGQSITGGYVYRGDSDGLQGHYFFADFSAGRLFTLHFNGTNWVRTDRTSQVTPNIGAINNPSSFGEDGRGNLYVVDFDGEVFRLTPNVTSADLGDTINGLGGNDMLFGGAGNDTLDGGGDDDTVYGGPGDDMLLPGFGQDLLFGDGGNDTLGPGTDSANDTYDGGPSNDTLTAGGGNDILIGGTGLDRLNGGAGGDRLTGNSGADRFVFDAAALADAQAATPIRDHVVDYDRGNSDIFSISEGDSIDLSALLSAAYNQGSGQAVASLVRVVADPGNAFAELQVDVNGTAGGANWVTLALLDSLQPVNSVNVILDAALPAGVTIGMQADVGFNGDFNGDGREDLLWRNDTGTFTTWQMNGNTAQANVFVGGAGNDWHLTGIGDFNGDLRDDLLWRNDTGTFTTWQMNGNTATPNVFVAQVGTDWHLTGIGDFNGDLRDDLLWRNDNGTFTTWQMNGNTATPNVFVAQVGTDWHLTGIGDFNGDLRDDLLWRNDNGSFTTWQMNGNTATPNVFVAQVGTDWHLTGIGDFNGDLRDDLLWRNDNGTFTTWQMNGNTATLNVFGAQVGNDWHLAGIGDFNGDGRDDLQWRNDDGAVTTWQMNGDTAQANVFASAVSTDWHNVTHYYDFV